MGGLYVCAAELPRHKGKQMYGPGGKWGTNPDAMIDKDFKRLSEVRPHISPHLAVARQPGEGGGVSSFKPPPHTPARRLHVVSPDISLETPPSPRALLGGNGTRVTSVQHR